MSRDHPAIELGATMKTLNNNKLKISIHAQQDLYQNQQNRQYPITALTLQQSRNWQGEISFCFLIFLSRSVGIGVSIF